MLDDGRVKGSHDAFRLFIRYDRTFRSSKIREETCADGVFPPGPPCPARNGSRWGVAGIFSLPGPLSSTAFFSVSTRSSAGIFRETSFPGGKTFAYYSDRSWTISVPPPPGEEAKHYNVLQKIAYTGVVFVLGPLIVLTGLTMSPMEWTPRFRALLTISAAAIGADRFTSSAVSYLSVLQLSIFSWWR